ncbi:minor tail protein [Microbacterium phage Knox]|uniref:Minor tail protein n=1 Tax=Microbacterium phage Knox TaxID=2079586 RepID=A0A2L0HNC0_9CAUD|nr:minor tail protein [Microbacterium phage Knox]
MGHRVTLWHSNQTVRTEGVLDKYGDAIDDVLLVAYELRTTGLVNLNIQNTVEAVRAKWPNIQWWLTIQCFSSAAWKMLNTDATFRASILSQMAAIYGTYPWITGVDLDAEGFGSNMTVGEAYAGYTTLGDHARTFGLKVSAALPAATEGNFSIGGENWLDYELFGAYLDRVAIMTYDFAWSGSAPGPIAPRFWIQQVYDWTVSVIDPDKVLMGIPAYGQNWSIHCPVEELPGWPGWPYRGNSGAYYWFWYMTTGVWGPMAGDDDPVDWDQTRASWLVFRDKETNSPFTLIGCYWWATAIQRTGNSGMELGEFNGRSYFTRYGQAAADPVGGMADQTVGTQHVTHTVRPIQVIDSNGQWANNDVHNITIEVLQRDPQSATIMDDDCATAGTLGIYYNEAGGADWTHWRQGDPLLNPRTYGQFRVGGAGRLSLTNIDAGGEFHVQGRFQLPSAGGRAGVFHGSYEATVDQWGTLILSRNGTTLATTSVSAPGLSANPGSGRAVIGLRVRGQHARVYYSRTEVDVPLVLEYNDPSYVAGRSGMVSMSGSAWFDHVRWGDAWWYNPREAVDVQVGPFMFYDVGRIPRSNVTWDGFNRFRVNTDVEERTTRIKSISNDWAYIHLKGVGIAAGTTRDVKFIPRDIDCWIGTVYLCDPQGTSLSHYADAEYMAHSRDLAHDEWGLAGVAVWRLGQEDVRFWERIKSGRLDPASRIPIL